MGQVRAWLRQPTTVAGISALIAAISALVLKQLTLGQVLPLVAGALASMALPDDSSAGPQARALAGELVADITAKKDSN